MIGFLKELQVPGNPRALARLLVILGCIAAAMLVGTVTPQSFHVIIGSFIGAALSLLVNWAVSVLETKKTDSTPAGFLVAAQSDVQRAGYYREKQNIRVSLNVDEATGEKTVVLRFFATIIPVIAEVAVDHPDIRAPEGVDILEINYKVDRTKVALGDDFPVKQKTSDELIVKYRVREEDRLVIQDDHFWPCPVLEYIVSFDSNSKCTFQASQIVGGMKPRALKYKQKRNITTFYSNGAAFTAQGLKWKLTFG